MKISKKELDKRLATVVKSEAKVHRLKKRGTILFTRINDYFIYIVIIIAGFKHEKIHIAGYVKPYIIDDLFWKVFNMPSNSLEPMGLRANGAFKVDGINLYSKSVEYEKSDNIEITTKGLLDECLSKMLLIVDGFENYGKYLDFSREVGANTLYDFLLVKMLLLIQEGRYFDAKEIADEQILAKRFGRFKNEGKYIYEHISEYCGKLLKV